MSRKNKNYYLLVNSYRVNLTMKHYEDQTDYRLRTIYNIPR